MYHRHVERNGAKSGAVLWCTLGLSLTAPAIHPVAAEKVYRLVGVGDNRTRGPEVVAPVATRKE